MSYVENNLMVNEEIVEKAKIHWFIFIIPSILIFSSFTFAQEDTSFFGALIFFVGMYFLVKSIITYISTELAVTNKRVIAKHGLIMRKTIELNLSKVESLNVDQGIFGRLFNYGKVTVNGTGGVKTPFSFIANPLDLRKAVNQEVEKTDS